MVLRMTGVSLLASMMRAGRDDDDRPPADPTWLLDVAVEPEVAEALERLAANEG